MHFVGLYRQLTSFLVKIECPNQRAAQLLNNFCKKNFLKQLKITQPTLCACAQYCRGWFSP